MVNNNKRAKLKGLFSDRRISFVTIVTGWNCITIKNNLTNIIYKNKILIENINHQFGLVKRN